MSEDNTTEFDDLLSRYLDVELNEREEAELLRCLAEDALAARFLEMTGLNAEIAGLSAAPAPDAVMVGLVMRDLRGEPDSFPMPAIHVEDFPWAMEVDEPARPRKWMSALRMSGIAACVCLAAAAVHFAGAIRGAPPAGVVSVRGEVHFVRPSGSALVKGVRDLRGDGRLQTLGAGSSATLVLADGTQIVMAGDTTVDLQLEPPVRRILLTAGSFRAHGVKQESGRPLVFATPNAEATVHGTEFMMIWENPNSLVIVTEGAVDVKRSADGFAVLVKAGSYTHVENNGVFRTWPIGLLPKQLQDEARAPK